MNIVTVIKKKIYYLYIALGFVLFIILSTLNYIYKNNILTLNLGYTYSLSASQYNNYKSKTHKGIFDYIFSNKIKTLHRVKSLKNNVQTIYFIKNKSEFGLTLILKDYVDDKKLEKIINEEYTKRIQANIEILEENLFLYDFETLEEEYKKRRLSDIQLASDKLNSTEFSKKYPAPNCINTVEFCLAISIKYYKFILENIKIDDRYNIQKFLNKLDDENYSTYNIYKDFNLNQNNYDNKSLRDLFNEPKYKKNFYRNKYKVLSDSKFVNEFGFTSITNCVHDDFSKNFLCVSRSLNELRKIYKTEINFPYSIKYQPPIEKQSFNLLFEIIKILMFTSLITYILFILTNKFLSRKLK
jgi:hypothetical protein